MFHRIAESVAVAIRHGRIGGKRTGIYFVSIGQRVAIAIRIERRSSVGSFLSVLEPVTVGVRMMRIGAGGDFRGVAHAVGIGIGVRIGEHGVEMVFHFERVGHAVAIGVGAAVDDLDAVDSDRVVVDRFERDGLRGSGQISITDEIPRLDRGE